MNILCRAAKEQFPGDTYFIMLGLAADGEWSPIQVHDEKLYLYATQGKFGMIPTANRAYFESITATVFALMVKLALLAKHRGRTRRTGVIFPSLLTEHRFWMRGRKIAGDRPDHAAYARVVRMPSGRS